MNVDNAIILAAGTASRFAPLSFEKPKSLFEVRGEILIERQIRQLREVGINEIVVVVGYMADQFQYLTEKYNVILVYNPCYFNRNNNASIYYSKKYLKNSYICSSDNYFMINPFRNQVDKSFYSSVYIEGKTQEWCIEEDMGVIKNVVIGGKDSWVMFGHSFWSKDFSNKIINIIEKEYNQPATADKLWEMIYLEHINELEMVVQKNSTKDIFEFDTLDELREFDQSYIYDTRSVILKKLAKKLEIEEAEIRNIQPLKEKDNRAIGFTFNAKKNYKYYYFTKHLEEIIND